MEDFSWETVDPVLNGGNGFIREIVKAVTFGKES